MKQALSILVAATITVIALAYALWDVDVNGLLELFSGARYWVFLPFLATLALHYFLKAQRWTLILHPLGEFTSRQVFPAMLIGFAGNNVLPAHLGEIIRTVVFARQFKQPVVGVFVSQFLERIFDVLAILLLYFCAATLVDDMPRALQVSAWIAAAGMAVGCAAIFAVAMRPAAVIAIWDRLTPWLPATLRGRGRGMLEHAILAISGVRPYHKVALAFGNSLLQWGLMGFNVWLALFAFGTSVSAPVSLIVLAVLVLAVTIPSAPGYVGAIQAAFVFALSPFGVANETAFAASVFFLVAHWVPVTAVGALCFLTLGLKAAALRRGVEDAEKELTTP